MTSPQQPKLLKLILRYKEYLLGGILIALSSIGVSLTIYYNFDVDHPNHYFWQKLADFLMTFGETILGAGLIGGGIGGSINFIFEELKKEDEKKEKDKQESREKSEKRISFRRKMQGKLQHAHDNVELARILIKSHKSGKTYGDQIRERIMPSLISLLEFKRALNHIEDTKLKKNLPYLQVSLRYMIAYLNVLIEEFEARYLKISNLQNYQDALATRMRTLFTEVAEGKIESTVPLEKKKEFLKNAEELFEQTYVPSNIEVVWQAIEELDYVWDFINELRDDKGVKSLYNQYFLQHYLHCKKILKTEENKISQKLVDSKNFKANKEELQRIDEKKNSDQPITNQDSLTRKIMENELKFDFETAKKKMPLK